jgi:hypothetical protein
MVAVNASHHGEALIRLGRVIPAMVSTMPAILPVNSSGEAVS